MSLFLRDPDVELLMLLDDAPRVNTRPVRVRTREELDRKDGFVYFAQMGDGPIKIGFSRNPEKRLKQMQTDCPAPLTLLGATKGTPALERRLHHAHSKDRLRGEWFAPSERLLAAIRKTL